MGAYVTAGTAGVSEGTCRIELTAPRRDEVVTVLFENFCDAIELSRHTRVRSG
jgi:hypothetical protein